MLAESKNCCKIFCAALWLLLFCLTIPASAGAEDYEWSDNGDGTCAIRGYEGPDGAIIIPDTLDGLTVIRIESYAFAGCIGLTGVTIPDSVTSIANNAFTSCTGLTSIAIPDSVTSIEFFAFAGCTNLASITIPDSVTFIGNSAFTDCRSMISFTIPSSIAGIQPWTFSGCTGLTSISVPDRVTYIYDHAFSGCRYLTSIKIGNGITRIGDSAFEYCYGLGAVYFKGNPPTPGRVIFPTTSNPTVYYLPKNAAVWPATFDGHPTAVWPLPAEDIDQDGEVNFSDFCKFADRWLQDGCGQINSWCGGSDFDQSGIVDIYDLASFAARWLNVI